VQDEEAGGLCLPLAEATGVTPGFVLLAAPQTPPAPQPSAHGIIKASASRNQRASSRLPIVMQGWHAGTLAHPRLPYKADLAQHPHIWLR
jgi:hypothetical protein